MCGPKQLLFFQSGAEMPEVWTPLEVKGKWKLDSGISYVLMHLPVRV